MSVSCHVCRLALSRPVAGRMEIGTQSRTQSWRFTASDRAQPSSRTSRTPTHFPPALLGAGRRVRRFELLKMRVTFCCLDPETREAATRYA